MSWVVGRSPPLRLCAFAPRARAQAATGPISDIGYDVNVGSFESFFPFDVSRTIDYAGAQWTAQGSSRYYLRDVGTTTATAPADDCLSATCSACGWTPYVFASACPTSGPDANCVTPWGRAAACTCGCGEPNNWYIVVYPNSGVGITATEQDGKVDLQNTIEHEFGHALGLKHETFPVSVHGSSA